MKKIVNKPLVASLLLLTVLGCGAAKKQESIIPHQENKRAASLENPSGSEKAANKTSEKSVPAKKVLIFNGSSCSWSYLDENGKLQAVSITDGKPKYVNSGEVHAIDLMKTEIRFK